MNMYKKIAISCAALLIVPAVLLAKCPIAPTGTLEVSAPAGNLIVDTTGKDSVEVEISNKFIPQETCGGNRVVVKAESMSTREIPDWKIRVPRTVTLDLTTFAGSITLGDTDGSVILRTTGSHVITGNIKGDAAVVTQGGRIHAKDIGGKAELRSQGGSLTVGNIGGDAHLTTIGGDIEAGVVSGNVEAGTGGGNIRIRQSNGRVNADTEVGSIIVTHVRGPFTGNTKSGEIRIEQAGSRIVATTGQGDISIKLAPDVAGDHSIDVSAGMGDIILYLPAKLKASIDALIARSAFGTKRFFSNFPGNALIPRGGRAQTPGGPEQVFRELNGGGQLVRARTSSGTITINVLQTP
jgi:hypothetical protein